MFSKFINCSIGIIFLLITDLSAQSFSIHKYTVEEGLPDNGVYDITQDDKGRMWFATLSGISCYDGSEWTNYDAEKGLPVSRFFRVIRDQENIIWAIPFNPKDSIAYFKNDTWKFLRFPNEKITALTSFEPAFINGSLTPILGTGEGVFIYKNNQWQKFTIDDGLPDNYINNIQVHKNKVFISLNGFHLITHCLI